MKRGNLDEEEIEQEKAAKELFRDQLKDIVSDNPEIPITQAFVRWVCTNIFDISAESVIDDAIIDGSNDNGIDVFYHEDTGDDVDQYLGWAQVKYSESLDYNVTREEMEDFVHSIDRLEKCPSGASLTFQQKSNQFQMVCNNKPHIRKRIIFVVAGKLSQSAENFKNLFIDDLADKSIDFDVFDMNKIISHLKKPSTKKLDLSFDGDTIQRNDELTGKKSIFGFVKADEIVRIVTKYRETIFLDNPRESLGKKTKANSNIIDTLTNNNLKQKFWKLNNGITATCLKFDRLDDSSSKFRIDNLRIVNGRQTTFALKNFYEVPKNSLDGVVVGMTIHETLDDNDEQERISEATNTQNPIKPSDMITNDPRLINLKLECDGKYDRYYLERQNGSYENNRTLKTKIPKRRYLEKVSTMRKYYAYYRHPQEALQLSQEKLFGDVINIFEGLKIEELLIPHIFNEMLEDLIKQWKMDLKNAKSNNSSIDIEDTARNIKILSKTIVKYFIIHYIYKEMSDLDKSTQLRIETDMIKRFSNLNKSETPEHFLNVAKVAFKGFMTYFNMGKNETWPTAIYKSLKASKKDPSIRPSALDITNQLKACGDDILSTIFCLKSDSPLPENLATALKQLDPQNSKYSNS